MNELLFYMCLGCILHYQIDEMMYCNGVFNVCSKIYG